MGEDDRLLDSAVRTDGIRDDNEGVVRKDADGGVGEDQYEAAALGVLGARGGAKTRIQARSLPAVVVFYPGDLYQLRMHPRQVVVLQVIHADELVVRSDFVPFLSHHPPLVQPVVREAVGQVAELLGERSSIRVEVDEDEEAPALCP